DKVQSTIQTLDDEKKAFEEDRKTFEEEKAQTTSALAGAKAENEKLLASLAEQKSLIESLQEKLVIARKKEDETQGNMAEELQEMSRLFSRQLDEEKGTLNNKIKELEASLEEQKLAAQQLKSDLSATVETNAQLEEKTNKLQAKLECKDKELEDF
ncbi:hypothetical protein BDZ91DRAFT_623484, partial [Kalaharituber pfeilii]